MRKTVQARALLIIAAMFATVPASAQTPPGYGQTGVTYQHTGPNEWRACDAAGCTTYYNYGTAEDPDWDIIDYEPRPFPGGPQQN